MAKEKRTRTLYESELGKAAAYEPTRAPEAEPFWRGCQERQLVLPWCTACERFHFYPRPFCPSCDSTAIEWRAVSGKGTVYTFAVVRQPIEEAFVSLVPYVLVIVELAEGVRLLSRLTGVDPDEVHCGMEVRVRFEDASERRTLPLFEPARTSREDT